MPTRLLLLSLVVSGSLACLSVDDDPSNVHDLRVLGLAFEPPELMAPDCNGLADAVSTFSATLQFRALIADPNGNGRDIDYDISACANPDNKTCNEVPDEKVTLGQGTLQAGEWSTSLAPGTALLADGSPLLFTVFNDDSYKGLGGLRMPVVLHLTAGAEEIYASKLMVFSCKLFPDSTPNVTPQVPGLRLNDIPWSDTDTPTVHGLANVTLTPEAFDDREEAYVVPSFSLSEVHLTEQWRLSWYTTLGTIAPFTTGGTDLGGQASLHVVQWSPRGVPAPQDVTFYVVARDGRGGESWLTRKVHFEP